MGPFAAPFLFFSVAVVSLFSFLTVASWSNARLKERESFYKNEMLKKLSESPRQGAASALEILREENRLIRMRRQSSLQAGGLITVSVGLALMVFLRALIPNQPIFLCGLIVLLPGFALVVSSYMQGRAK